MKINVFVKGPDGVKRTLNIEHTATVEEFKQAAEEVLDMTIKSAIFGGEILTDDTKTLNACGVKNMSVIQIIERVHGGQQNR